MEESDEGPTYDLRTLLRHREVVEGQVADVSLQAKAASSLPEPVLKSKNAHPWAKGGKRDKKSRHSPQPAVALPNWSARPWNAKVSLSAQASPSASPTIPNLDAFEDDGEGQGEGEPEDEVAFQVVQATFAEEGEEEDDQFGGGFHDHHAGGSAEPDAGYSAGGVDEDPDEDVRQIVEYYLSDQNVSIDPILHGAISDAEDGWLGLQFLLASEPIGKFGVTEADIVRVLRDSEDLETRPEGRDQDGLAMAAAVRRRQDLPPLQASSSGSYGARRQDQPAGVDDVYGAGPWAMEGGVHPPAQEPGAKSQIVVHSLLPGYWKDSLGNDVFVPQSHGGEMVAHLYWKWGGVKKLPVFVDPDKNSRIWCGNGMLEHAGYPLGAAPGSSPTQLHWRTWDGRLSIWYKEGQEPWAGDDEFGPGGGSGGGHWVQSWSGDKGAEKGGGGGGGKGQRWKGGGWKGGDKGGGHGAGAAPGPSGTPADAGVGAPGAKGTGKSGKGGGKGGKGGDKGGGGKSGAHALTLGDFFTIKEAKGKKKKKAAVEADDAGATPDTA